MTTTEWAKQERERAWRDYRAQEWRHWFIATMWSIAVAGTLLIAFAYTTPILRSERVAYNLPEGATSVARDYVSGKLYVGDKLLSPVNTTNPTDWQPLEIAVATVGALVVLTAMLAYVYYDKHRWGHYWDARLSQIVSKRTAAQEE